MRRLIRSGSATPGKGPYRADVTCCGTGAEAGSQWAEELPEQTWRDMIDVHLTGVWHTAKAAIPHLRADGHGGSIIVTSSTGGLEAFENGVHYVAAKHGGSG